MEQQITVLTTNSYNVAPAASRSAAGPSQKRCDANTPVSNKASIADQANADCLCTTAHGNQLQLQSQARSVFTAAH
jgi:hypothetical protein